MIDRLLNPLYGRRLLQPAFSALLGLSLRGMNLGGIPRIEHGGESRVLRSLTDITGPVVFDVGANRGDYAAVASAVLKGARVWAFEPSPEAYSELRERFRADPAITTWNVGLGDTERRSQLFADRPGSSLSSLVNRRLEHHGIVVEPTEFAEIVRLDHFCAEHAVSHIDLLKLDVEGAELEVLVGAERMISNDLITRIQFEFGGCNIDSRTYFRDFFDLLSPRYRVYRIVRDGFVPIRQYSECCELFIYGNYFAKSRRLEG